MVKRLVIVLVFFLTAFYAFNAFAQNDAVFFRDNFNDLGNWKPLTFKKIEKHTGYSIEISGDSSYLRADSSASASGLILSREFRVFDYPKMKWRWKVSNIYVKGNAKEKSGDDYPLRVYVIFKYDPGNASFARRLRYGLVKNLYGDYPPDSTLNYIWANRHHDEKIITNTYAAESKMIILQEGAAHAGKWIEQEVDIIEDYHRAFRQDPPAVASIAIMSDSDNTGESAVSYIDYIEVFR